MKPALSIIIPTYNRGHTLSKVLAQLYAQRDGLRDTEVIIVDDGSTDGTAAVVQPYVESEEIHCRYLYAENGGPSVARNRGIQAAKGRIVLFLDCDIIPSDRLVFEHRRFHERFPGIVYALRGSVVAVQSQEDSVRSVEFHGQGSAEEVVPTPWNAFRSGNVSLKRDFLLERGMFDHDLRTQEDTELGYRLRRHGLQLFHSDRAVGYHDHPMQAPEYFKYATVYGRSMAVWYAKTPGLVDDLRKAGIEHRYGFIAWSSSPSRKLKHVTKILLVNQLTIQVITGLGMLLRTRAPRSSGKLMRLAYYYHFKRSYRKHFRSIINGEASIQRPARVLMLASLLPPEYSGAARQALALTQELSRRGLDCLLLSATLKRDHAGWQQVGGIRTYRMYMQTWGPLNKVFLTIRLSWLLAKHRRHYDILHVHGGTFLINGPTLIGRWLGKKIVLKMTAMGEDDPMHLRRCRLGWLKYRLFLLADAYIATSPALAESYRQSGLPQEKLSTIPNGVDLDKFRPATEEGRTKERSALGLAPGRPIAVSVGALIPRKCIDALIRVWPYVIRELPMAQLIIVGPAVVGYEACAERLRTSIRDLRLEESVMFVGRQDEPEAYLRAADTFLFVSEREGMPNALLEAMACGLPCVTVRIPGITDDLIEHGRAGLVVERQDEQGLIESVVQVLSDKDMSRHFGEAARKHVEQQFGFAAIGQCYMQLYAAMLGIPRPVGVPNVRLNPTFHGAESFAQR